MEIIKREDTTRTLGESQGYLPLHVTDIVDEHGSVMLSQWRLSDDERADIAAGKDVHLWVWGSGHPPVMITIE